MGQIRHKIEKIKSTFKKCFRIVICNCLQYVLVCVLLCGLLREQSFLDAETTLTPHI